MDANDIVKQEFRIPDERLAGLRVRMEKLSRKAQKLMGASITLTVVEVVDVERMEFDAETSKSVPTGIFDRFHVVTVEGPRPKLAGWELVAELQHLSAEGEEVTVVRAVPGQTVPEQYRNSSALVCDHCQTRRNRNETFLVRHEDGTFKKVGRNCIADFLGHQDPADLIRYFEYLLQAQDEAEEESSGGGNSKFFSLVTFLGFVAANIRVDGWLSRSNARNAFRDGQASADQALNVMFSKGQAGKEYFPTAADTERVTKAMEYMKTFLAEQTELNDYLHNLSVVLKLGVIDFKLAGIAGSLLPTAEREMGKEVERRRWSHLKETSKHVGAVGDKVVIRAHVLSIREMDSNYGVTTMIKFASTDGNALTWFASGNKTEEWDSEAEYILAATVKKHDIYQGMKQTVLTRVNAVTQAWVDAEAAKAARKAARAAKKAAATS